MRDPYFLSEYDRGCGPRCNHARCGADTPSALAYRADNFARARGYTTEARPTTT